MGSSETIAVFQERNVIETQSLFKKGRKFGFSEWTLHAYMYTF